MSTSCSDLDEVTAKGREEGGHKGVRPRRGPSRRKRRTTTATQLATPTVARRSSPEECRLCLNAPPATSSSEVEMQLLECPSTGMRAHYLCLLFSSGLHQRGEEEEELKGFLVDDVKSELRRGNRLRCVHCKMKGATVGCARPKCKKSYHLPCGMSNGSMQQHFDQFKSFCSTHRSGIST